MKTVYSITLFLFVFCFLTNVNAQNIAIEQDGACINCPDLTADPSAALEIRATDRGILIPRLANTSAVANPVEGLMIYDNSVDAFQYYNGARWEKIREIEHISFPLANTFVGTSVGISNTTGNRNVGIGADALFLNTTGNDNTASGVSALAQNTTGNDNTASGLEALWSNKTGNNNTAVGSSALRVNRTGNDNTAVGYNALSVNNSGNGNTAFGGDALNFNSGSSNTAIGHLAFSSLITNYDNSTAIGFFTLPTGSNQVRLGNNAVTSIGGYANWSNISDARFKKQVRDDVPGLAFIGLLRPVTYQMDMDAIAKHHHTPDSLRLAESERAKSAIRYTGFLAQEVEKAAESLAYDFSGVDAPQHERDNYSLRYAEFVVPLVKAVQELDAEKDKEIAELKQKNADLEARLEKIEALLRQRVE